MELRSPWWHHAPQYSTVRTCHFITIGSSNHHNVTPIKTRKGGVVQRRPRESGCPWVREPFPGTQVDRIQKSWYQSEKFTLTWMSWSERYPGQSILFMMKHICGKWSTLCYVQHIPPEVICEKPIAGQSSRKYIVNSHTMTVIAIGPSRFWEETKGWIRWKLVPFPVHARGPRCILYWPKRCLVILYHNRKSMPNSDYTYYNVDRNGSSQQLPATLSGLYSRSSSTEKKGRYLLHPSN